MPTIPASQLVSVNPAVLPAAGNAFSLLGLFITESTRVPIGTVPSFADASAVTDYFGANTTEAEWATIYFTGFDGKQATPNALFFAQYNASAVAGYLRGGNVSGLTLTQLQAISGTLTVTVDGNSFTDGSLNLSSATSFSNAATIIASGLNGSPPTEASFTGVISTTTLTASSVTGSIIPGQAVAGSGVTAGTVIIAQLTGATPGGAGTYSVNHSQTVASEAMTTTSTLAVTYDSLSGGFLVTAGTTGPLATITYATGTTAASLALTSVTGAVLSQGAAATTPIPFMDSVIGVTQQFATFLTTFDPDGGSGNTLKLEFAQWTNEQNNAYVYSAWDTDALPSMENPDSSSLGYLVNVTNNYSGTIVQSDAQAIGLAAFTCGYFASLNFAQTNGRFDLAYRTQSGLSATVNNLTSYTNLLANGYNVMGAFASRTTNFISFQPGAISGPFKWADTFADQLYMNNSFVEDLLTLLQNVGSMPYDPAGYATIETGLLGTINAMINYGAIRQGVTLSASQVAEVNAAAGLVVAPTIQQQGWYLQILDPGASVRQARGTPVINFWWTDGESIQKLTLNSITLQ